jgi:cell division transport system permease protein
MKHSAIRKNRSHSRVKPKPSQPLHDQPRRRIKPLQQSHVWLSHHLYALYSTLERIARTPLPSLMTAAVIAIALAMPTGFYLLL